MLLVGKIFALVLAVGVALYLGDTFGPIGRRPFDWAAQIPYELTSFIYFKHYLILGLFTGIAGSMVKVFLKLPKHMIFAVVFLLGIGFVLSEYFRLEYFEIENAAFQITRFLPSYLIGYFSATEMLSLLRRITKGKQNGSAT